MGQHCTNIGWTSNVCWLLRFLRGRWPLQSLTCLCSFNFCQRWTTCFPSSKYLHIRDWTPSRIFCPLWHDTNQLKGEILLSWSNLKYQKQKAYQLRLLSSLASCFASYNILLKLVYSVLCQCLVFAVIAADLDKTTQYWYRLQGSLLSFIAGLFLVKQLV